MEKIQNNNNEIKNKIIKNNFKKKNRNHLANQIN